MRWQTPFINFAVFAAFSFSAGASTVWYTDRTAWLAALGGSTQTIGFEGIAPAGGIANSTTDPGFTINGVSFTGNTVSQGCFPIGGCFGPTPGNTIDIADPGADSGAFNDPTLFQWSSGAVLAGPVASVVSFMGFGGETTASLVIGLGAGKSALGWDYKLGIDPFSPGMVTLSNGDSQAYGNAGFLAFISTDNVTSLEMTTPLGPAPIVGNLNLLMLDNVTFASAKTEVPEPRFLLAAGLLFLVGLRRKKSQVS